MTIHEVCRNCGECLKPYTRKNKCPMEDCPKNMLNGPCGGVHDGICELGTQPCVWVQILEDVKKKKRLGEYLKIRVPELK